MLKPVDTDEFAPELARIGGVLRSVTVSSRRVDERSAVGAETSAPAPDITELADMLGCASDGCGNLWADGCSNFTANAWAHDVRADGAFVNVQQRTCHQANWGNSLPLQGKAAAEMTSLHMISQPVYRVSSSERKRYHEGIK
ncbi:hypothetical protein [Paenibacillus andongensis]|uniref:hypothetical protein n=1 Tax=Paenibacillus andongensis TaxID=2975482 RepID=UPI0021BAB34D|nr:hypothetical protein [Paenibacillus andongensis]